FVLAQAAGITGSVHFFVMRAGNMRYALQMTGKRQAIEHDDGLDNVLVDLEALFGGQRTAPYAQVVKLAVVVGMSGYAHVEAPNVVRVVLVHRGFALAPGHNMV